MKETNLFLLSFLFISFLSQAQAPVDPRLKGLDSFVNHTLRDWHAPGVSIAVVEKNKVVYTGGFGYRDYEKKLPVTENTLFAIGSCTKAFTASMLGMLENDGKLNFDKPVRDYLPELRFFNDYLNEHVTLRDMMCHRTGLPRHDISWYGSAASRSELIARIQWLEPSAELREKWQYNNFMFMALGVVVEKLTGKSWEENVKEKILTPLGMSLTDLSVTDMATNPDHSLAYDVKKDSQIHLIPFRNIDAMAPCGAMNSCAKDMAAWLITWINGGKFNGTQVIPVTYITQAMTVHMPMEGGGLPTKENPDIYFSGYGLGWSLSSYRGHYRVEHGGGVDGFITTTGFFPSDSIGIFVVSDQWGPTASISNFIADRMLKLSYRNWNKTLLDEAAKDKKAAAGQSKNDSLNHKTGTKPSHLPSEYAGTYSNPGYGIIEITCVKDSLFGKFNSFNLRLDHFHFDQFKAKILGEGADDQVPLKLSFQLDGRGDIEKLSIPLELGVKDVEFKKQRSVLGLGKSELEKYVGDYELGSQTVKVYLKGDKTLMVLVPGQPDYELVPVKADEFNIKILPGYSLKFDVKEKTVTALFFIQPNGTFKATRKK